MKTALIAVIVGAVASIALGYSSDALKDQVTSLPGLTDEINFNQFSGYLTVGSSKNMHYWMVEAVNDPATAPIAFWTNGGPGCSGLLGFLTEQGPFKPQADGSLKLNSYAWNQNANMVFIEAPCGVGFSYSDNKDDYQTGDAQTASDNYDLIQAFLVRFPEYSKNDLYISSESYGGHYMPTLAQKIVQMNAAGNNPTLNFKGFAVGNPMTTVYSATPSGLVTLWGHQMIAKPTWDTYEKNCADVKNFNFTICETLMMEMFVEIGPYINHYALDYPVCVDDERVARGRGQRNALLRHLLTNDLVSDKFRSLIKLEPEDSYQPCADDYATTYMNRADVKAAIHVNNDIEWEECSRTIRYDQGDSKNDMTEIYNYLLEGDYGLHILVYSGDDDDVCPTEGTQSWIWDLKNQVVGRKWQHYEVDNQTGGYLTKFTKNMAFATVHGAGHEVPTYKPEVALSLWNQYLNGELTNSKW